MSNVKFTRDTDGILVPVLGRHYQPPVPNEAIKTWWGGKLRLGCNASVHSSWNSSPCGNTPKHDPDVNGRFTKCGIHSAAAEARREGKKKQEHVKWRAQTDAKAALRKAEAALEQALDTIAAGHNDPRSVAIEALRNLMAARAAIAKAEGRS